MNMDLNKTKTKVKKKKNGANKPERSQGEVSTSLSAML
jgi:hypothetical protein